MTTDPRAALDRLVSALEAHLAAAGQRRGTDDPAVIRAYDILADAFETYDQSLYEAYDETTPFELYDEDEDEDDDQDDDDVVDLDEDDLVTDDFDDHVDEELEQTLNRS